MDRPVRPGLNNTGVAVRKTRVLVIGVAVVAMLATFTASRVLAAGSITAFTINGHAGAYLLPTGAIDFNPGNSTLTVSPFGDGLSFDGQKSNPSHHWTMEVTPPTGEQFAVGTYSTHRSSGVGFAGIEMFGDGRGCNTSTGSLTIAELERDGTNAIVAFAASYQLSCEGIDPNVTGELRWDSTVDYLGVTAAPESVDFGTQADNVDTAPVTVTITADGTLPVNLGTATLTSDQPPPWFTVSNNGCDGQNLAAGQSCTITIVAHPTSTAFGNATLSIPTNSSSGLLTVPLTVHGYIPFGDLTVTPPSVAFGTVQVDTVTADTTVFAIAGGNKPTSIGVTLDGAGFSAFAITTDTCNNVTLSPGQQCSVSLHAKPTALGTFTASLLFLNDGRSGLKTVPLSVTSVISAVGTYYPYGPYRVLDTRNGTGTGGSFAPLGPGGVLHLRLDIQGGLPSGLSAVVLNVTVTSPTAASYLAVYPTGSPRPNVSNLNFPKGFTGANNVTVPVGPNDSIDIYNLSGSTHVIVDELGFYAGDNSVATTFGGPNGQWGVGGQYQPVLPERILDTRWPGFGGQLPGGYFVTIPVDYGDFNAHIRALAVNVTAANAKGKGFLTTWDGQSTLPLASTLNFAPKAVVPNLAIVPVAPCDFDPGCAGMPSIAVYNGSTQPTDVIVDIVGVYDDGSLGDGLNFHPIAPTRITDTRIGLGAPTAIGPKATATITTPPTVARINTVALAANVTAVAPTASTFLSVWPADAGLTQPTVSTVNAVAGQIVPNAALITIGPEYGFNIFNNAGKTNVLVDVAGTFDFEPLGAPSASITSALQRTRLTSSLITHLFITQPRPVPFGSR